MEDAKLNVVAGERGTSIEAVQGSDSTTSKAKDERISCFKLFYDWRHCTSATHQFHQYYIYGELNPCKVEKERMYNCFKWKTMGRSKDKAKNALFDSLKAEKTNMHSPDTPWELRKEPFSDWNK